MGAYDVVVGLAADAHGLVRAEDATREGVTAVALHRLAQDQRLERIAHGLYHVRAVPFDRLTPYMEAVLWARGVGVISHASALEMQELCDILPRRIHLTVPRAYNPRKAGHDQYHVHRLTLPPDAITNYEGVPVVTAATAITQALADGEDREQLRLAVRNASQRGLLLRREAARLWPRLR
ncbi:type IV toxin-antitoxin system AbiEi family antitoxin domain-containing protein [Actinotalea sp. M2MS4P-6]|uniref:type IV toxin-antitoxin system AbiEi family antitoxin domain-containing protein n=1 Tax=Actinotalea sp. M2MS4P-6 TaxID=2983762 RepID=UPI0021E375D7|nr:type IV toxin-antitoxin system AbiEi family antitoxin domain-containing protein [Actinotalea sp. M2MS4P-6]MCV2396264.1 type IV toxin-antitoxin system AbiEi family antitoxin domain-containing protein [Actinotalea sp. M2MS4P-6]